jgi:preprotein translocase subunit SecY
MINSFFHKVKLTFGDSEIRARVFFVLGALAIFRLLAVIPIPGVDKAALASFFASNQFFGLLNIFSGGGLAQLSIVMLGVGPYITASIVMQLATIVFPQVKQAYFEEGEAGRARFVEWSRLLAIPIAVLQSIGFLFLLQGQHVIGQLGPVALVANVALVAAGSMLLMWLGELVTEFGIGNGVSLIILAGILASVPSSISHAIFASTAANIPAYLAFIALAGAMIYAVVVVSDADCLCSCDAWGSDGTRGCNLPPNPPSSGWCDSNYFRPLTPPRAADGALDAHCNPRIVCSGCKPLVYRLPQ